MTTAPRESRSPAEPDAPRGPGGPSAAAHPCPQWRHVQRRYPALSSVSVEEVAGSVRLGGRVPSHYLKQVALAAACEVAGSRPIVNEIVVVARGPRPPAVGTDPRPGPDTE